MQITIKRSTPVKRTARVLQLEGLFDLPPTKRSELTWTCELPLDAQPWNIGLIVGPSGCGKSTLARELFGPEGQYAAGTLISGFDWPADRAVVDEFTSVVDRTVAQVGSAAIAKAVRRRDQKFVAVGCHYDVVDWLQPDWIFEPATATFHWRCLRPRPPLSLQIVRAHRNAWPVFKHHHYLDTNLSKSARCFVGCVADATTGAQRPAVFTAVISFPHAVRPGWIEHRTVCLPDFQGVGLGNAMSEYVASLFAATGKVYRSTTSNPAMIRHRARSPLWNMHRKPSQVAAQGKRSQLRRVEKGIGRSMHTSRGRITAGFEYVGPPSPHEARQFGIV